MSHPVWVRGLKQKLQNQYHEHGKVAPRVGAWIETPASPDDLKLSDVAPRVGAWIETVDREKKLTDPMSHPVWVRGLKLEVTLSNNSDYKVAPRVGAWIETLNG